VNKYKNILKIKTMKKLKPLILIFVLMTAGCSVIMNLVSNKTNINTSDLTDVSKNLKINTGSEDADQSISNWLDDKSNKISNDLKSKMKDAIVKFSESYNVTDFNYAIAFGDNSTPYESKGNFKQAKSFVYYLADPQSMGNEPPKIKGQNYNYGGEILYVSNKYKLSENSFRQALKVYQDAGLQDSAFASLTVSNLGLLYQTTGRYSKAEEFTQNALNQRENGNDKTGYAASLNNISVLYKDMGMYTESEENIGKAQKFLEKENKKETVN
jgi:tetratricopeptide (TPR) repeat protein